MTPNRSQFEIALELAMRAHGGQTDLDGKPVILHPLTVALQGYNEKEMVVGLLHDVVEDSDLTFDDLLAAGIEPEFVDSLRLLTHNNDEDYLDYVKRIADSRNYAAINVKYRDLTHNIKRGREGDYLRLVDKHTKALDYIHPINGDEDAAWEFIMDDPEEGAFWEVKHDFTFRNMTIDEACAKAGVTVDEYMEFFHPSVDIHGDPDSPYYYSPSNSKTKR